MVQLHTYMRTHQSEAMIKQTSRRSPCARCPRGRPPATGTCPPRDRSARARVQNDTMNVDTETDEVESGTSGPSEDVSCSPDDLDLPLGPPTEAELEHTVHNDADRAQSARFGRRLEARFGIAQGDGDVFASSVVGRSPRRRCFDCRVPRVGEQGEGTDRNDLHERWVVGECIASRLQERERER